MKKYFAILPAILFIGSVSLAHAIIFIPALTISSDTEWTLAGSPYLINQYGAIVRSGATLTVDPGVVVKTAPYAMLNIQGTLKVLGTKDHPAVFTSTEDDTVGGVTSGNYPSTAALGASQWRISIPAAGSVEVTNTIFKTAITPLQFSGGRGFISQSSFPDYGSNETEVITNSSSDASLVIAQNNWWGDAGGPYNPASNPSGEGGLLGDFVSFKPWLPSDPFAPEMPACCSSVAFLPGIEASRLAKPGLISENQLWEPNRNLDVQTLSLDSSGNSLDSSAYVNGIVDRTNITGGIYDFNIYKSFMAEMDGMVASSTIAGWKPLAYDWRLDWNDVVEGGAKQKDGSVEYMIPEIEKLAVASKTGKVTIIAHSMGGLVAKVLIQKLAAKGKADLIDKLVMVATPQLGTPKAAYSLLHGYEAGLPVVLDDATARAFGQNMPGAYGLLPSKQYFSAVDMTKNPIIQFDPSIDSISNFRNVYGNSITTAAALAAFLTGSDGRKVGPSDSLLQPLVLNTGLLAKASATHDAIDTAPLPANIQVIQVAGWGLNTVSGFKYVKEDSGCDISLGFNCSPGAFADPQPIFNSDGDNTVVSSSATAIATSTYYIDIHAYNNANNTHNKHANIFEVKSILNLLGNLIKESTTTTQFVTITKPNSDDADKRIYLSAHSPVSIDLYDSAGRHTGIVQNPDPNSDIDFIEEQIPNTSYMEFGEGKYVGFDGGVPTNVKILGTGSGTFTINTAEVSGATTTSSSIFQDIPVLPETVAAMSFSATGTPTLSVDLDGDGKNDFVLKPQQSFDPVVYLQTMRTIVLSFNLKKDAEKDLLGRIDALIRNFQKGKIKLGERKISALLKNFSQRQRDSKDKNADWKQRREDRKHHPKMTAQQIQVIIDMLNQLLININ